MRMPQVPEFTVIIPCYNDALELPRAVNSVVAQTCQDWEIVIVDDGSTDATPAVSADLSQTVGPRVRYHRQPNSGVSSARNAGIEQARASYLVFLDADDELMPEALADYLETIRTAAEPPAWIIGAHELVRGDAVKRREVKLPTSREDRFKHFIRKAFFVGNVSNMCFAAVAFKQIRFAPNLPVGEDTAVFALLFATLDSRVIDKVTARINRRLTSLRTQSSLAQLAQSEITSVIFDHPALPPEMQRFKADYKARRARSLAGHAQKAGQQAEVLYWSAEALRLQPNLWFSPKVVLRYLKARLAQSGAGD